MRKALTLFAAALLGISTQPLLAQDASTEDRWAEGEFGIDLIHSPLPIYSGEWEEFWPRHFVDGTSFGCSSRISFGDWQFKPNPSNEYGDEWWIRFSNYGVFHCAINIREEYARADLENGEFSRGFFAKIGETDHSGSITEIWVLQQGFRTGSDYILLAREPSSGVVEQFSVLQRRCPADRLLRKTFDSWLTEYCWIETHEELLDLATEMLALPALGTLQKEKGPDTSVPDPSTSDNSD